MAKLKPSPTLMEMEQKLGYKINDLNYPDEPMKRFYSDLRPVPHSIYERTRKEFEEHEKQRSHNEYEAISEKLLPECGAPFTIAKGEITVTFTRTSPVGFYSFAVDVHYTFGLDLLLLFTKNETLRAMGVPKLTHTTTLNLGPMFSKLPKELRDKIYMFALPRAEWRIEDLHDSEELNFVRGIGDPTGFYFPLSSLAILRVNRQMRVEALPIAYRRTVFHLDDMDDLIKLLIAVGDVGRDNMQSLELAWQSRSDSECQWAEAPYPNEYSLTLPNLHVATCVKLLKQCRSLSFLRLYFESDLILGVFPDACKAHPGICELCSIRGIERVELWDLGHEPLEQCGFVKSLKEAMESEEDGDLIRAILEPPDPITTV